MQNQVLLTMRSCSLDVLGLKDADDENQSSIFEEFNDQLERKVEGFYETGLMWKSGETELPNNRSGSLARLGKLVQKLERDPELFSAYDKIMKDQEAEGIIEEANSVGTVTHSVWTVTHSVWTVTHSVWTVTHSVRTFHWIQGPRNSTQEEGLPR